MKLILFLLFIYKIICQPSLSEFYPVNLTDLNLSPQLISLANVKYYTAYTQLRSTIAIQKRAIHQIFIENQQQVGNASFPIFIMPFGYAPGISSLYSLFNELGSFTFSEEYQTEAQLQSLPYGLQINQNSFAKYGHILMIDPIPGVGLSYWSGSAPTNFTFTDSQVVSDVYSVLQSFLTDGGYPNSTYYIIGNGYAAKIATLLASTWTTQLPKLKLGGLFLQNPAIQYDVQIKNQSNQEDINFYQFLNDHNLIGDTVASSLSACSADTNSAVCRWGIQQLINTYQNLNFNNIYNYCFNDGLTPQNYCGCIFNTGLYNLVNDQQFKNAFLAIFGNHTESVNFQNIFNTNINYTLDSTTTTFNTLQSLINANQINICIYNGDASAILSDVDTKYYLNAMNLVYQNNQVQQALLNVRYPQPIGLQLGGIYTCQIYYNFIIFLEYNGLLYAQIKKGGFFTAKDKPQATLALLNFYLTGQQQQ